MFPYADNPDSYWTGYFSSRANDKQQVRRASSSYHSSNQLITEKMLDQSKDVEDFQDELIEGSWALLDDLSILQHHDAVSGTAKQAVADDYAWRLFTGMKKNNEGYFKLIDETISKMTGIANQTWAECFRTNSTYVDCPVSAFEDQKDYTMNVAVQNPSTIDMSQTVFAVPNGKYGVKVFNTESKAFETVNASVSCWDDYAENNVTYKACNIKISHTTKARDFSLFQLTQNDAAELSINNGTVIEGSIINNGKFGLVYEGSVKDSSQINFKLNNYQTGSSETFDFSMKYWASFINYYSWVNAQSSGDYIFRQNKGQYEAMDYSTLVGSSMSDTQMDFQFHSINKMTGEEFQKIIVHVSLDADLEGIIKFEVDLGSLPPIYYDGFEVVANFHSSMDNNQTFWTDSNGLEMQKRILNYRPTWDLVNKNYKDSLENITANYFPVQSAISMRDEYTGKQFTVMNDRSQGGSALKNGNIEFMQNRRIPADDGRGMGEYFNERDSLGNGIRVPASYYVQIFNSTTEKPLQRQVQMKVDMPQQMVYSFGKTNMQTTPVKISMSDAFKKAGITDLVKLVTIPEAKNHFILRLENVADLYDKDAATQTVDLQGLLDAMWKNANMQAPVDYTKMDIKEMSLTANMELQEMLARKIQWKTVDDNKENLAKSKINYDSDFSAVKLEPQRIRTYTVAFETATEDIVQ